MIDFFPKEHISCSSKKRFGVCDVPAAEEKAYIAEREGENWIAVVDNYYQSKVNFVPIDHCIELLRPDDKMDNRCDGCLFYEKTTIFVELKDRSIKGTGWIKDAERQLRHTIRHFEDEKVSDTFKVKKAYIANSAKPRFQSGQAVRMENFFAETKYVLRIENTIEIV